MMIVDFNSIPVAEKMKREIPILGATDAEILSLRDQASQWVSRYQHAFTGLETCCMFIGYPRSGHSIIGSLLDAHPRMTIAHELHIARFLHFGFSAEQVYALLLENSRIFTEHGRTWGGYCYGVAGQWQGKYTSLKVIGDKKGGATSYWLGRDPTMLERLVDTIKLKIRLIHVIRDPYDNIVAIAQKHTKSLIDAVSFYAELCRANRTIIERMSQADIFELHHEDFIANPQSQLASLCEYLGVTPERGYLDACAAIVYRKPHKRRDSIQWPPEVRTKIKQLVSEFEFLQRY